ncbi:putative baseplate assembly protein [Halobacteriales archaeon QS_8_69_26]|nr:MAG: putative baseplate assembly protein [Halobacteriales archaeon QS_8_69_26]
MTLEVPDLNDRDYEELVEEARKLIPAYSDEWTNHNPSDPGMAILEMLAWITETYTYQLDQVTDEHRRKYLQLMGEQPRPPTPASAKVELHPPEGVSGATVPASVALVVSESADGNWTDHSHANGADGMFYRAFGDDPSAGDEFYLGFDADPLAGGDTLSVTVDFHDDDLPEPASHGDEASMFDPSVEVVWEYCRNYYALDHEDAWGEFEVVSDDTNAFYRGGTVTLAAPDEWDPEKWGVDEHGLFDVDPGTVWIRCRLVEAGYEIPPQFDSVKVNVVETVHQETIRGEVLQQHRTNEGPENLSDQRYQFEHAPVLEAEITVDDEPWTEVEGFEASGPTDRHYVLDRAEGEVRFGDGVRGKMPDPDRTVVAERYVRGGGRAGNVPASSTVRFADVDKTVGDDVRLLDVDLSLEGDATGGRDAESIDEAFRRVKRDLATPYRAVTADDIKYVATNTPGVRFGRATVLVDSRESGPPEVNVVVVPYVPPDVGRADPSEGFIDAVQRHVDKHRLLTDRVTVREPTYVGLDLEVDVVATGWQLQAEGEDAIESAIQEYVDPIHGYEGDGWPFGRTLYKEELLEILEDLDWIDTVREVSVTARGNATLDSEENVKIGDDSLFYLDNLVADIATINRNGR